MTNSTQASCHLIYFLSPSHLHLRRSPGFSYVPRPLTSFLVLPLNLFCWPMKFKSRCGQTRPGSAACSVASTGAASFSESLWCLIRDIIASAEPTSWSTGLLACSSILKRSWRIYRGRRGAIPHTELQDLGVNLISSYLKKYAAPLLVNTFITKS